MSSFEVSASRASPAAEEWMERARSWLDELKTPTGLRASSAADIYNALFGRDSLLTIMLALEAARLRPGDTSLAGWTADLAANSLRALAATQGTQERDENEEQPGKIIHEYWPDAPERLRIGHWPLYEGRYYGSVDATYLYLMAAGMVWEQVDGGRDLVESLWDHVLAALHWALTWGDVDGDGLVEVYPRQPQGWGLRNQIWTDSGDALLLQDGSAPQPPVAWVEVQGYALAAFRCTRKLLEDRGEEPALQAELAKRMERLQQALMQFWLLAERLPAMVLTSEKQALPLVSSNPGHVLWCDAMPAPYADATASRLLEADMLTAWGVRTLASSSYAFDPLSYHRGSIWPFDNALFAAALWRMGRRENARMIGRRVLDAFGRFGTPVELYCALPAGWVRAPDLGDVEALVVYQPACSVQAWSAAAMLLFGAQLLAGEEPAA